MSIDLTLAVAQLPEREQLLILRSCCHEADERWMPVAVQFCQKVSVLDAARLIHAIERGATVVEHDRVWTDLGGSLRARMPHLTRIVNECLRLGLVTRTSTETFPDVWLTRLATAPVHFSAGLNTTRCPASRNGQTRRFRLTEDPALVDCKACLKADR